jgi:hypothetical protein
MTTGVKLTAIDTKIQVCERLRDRLEKMAAIDLEDSDNAALVSIINNGYIIDFNNVYMTYLSGIG